MKKYLKFVEDETYEGKTKAFRIINKISGVDVGEIKWKVEWRQYCFYPDNFTFWTSGCLNEVTEFIDKLMEERK